jgi:DNA-directed RNA polymerase specialized sigma24 family protein
VFAHDWRRVDVDAWSRLTGERARSADEPLAAPARSAAALPWPELADAVRRALRDLHHTDALAANPLMRLRAVGDPPCPERLRDLIADAIESLRVDPRDEKLHRALARTYVRPAQTQELAAEALGLPFSTYRRHLTRGVQHVTAWLWHRELYGSGEQ